jgi:hypothetical protein
MNLPPEMEANPAADMAVISGVLENMGNIPVPVTIRLVATAIEVN